MEAIVRLSAHASAVSLALVGTLGASAGIHAGLFAAHARDERALAVSFLVASLGLAAVALAVAFRPGRLTRLAAAALFAALLVAYVVVRHDPVDGLAALTKLVEAAGLALALSGRRLVGFDEPGTPIGVLTLALAAGILAAGGHGH